MDTSLKDYKKEDRRVILFILTVVFSQGIRGILNNMLSTSIFNYTIESFIFIIYILIVEGDRNKVNIFVDIIIFFFGILSFFINDMDTATFIRENFTIFMPMLLLIINSRNLDIKYIISKCVKILNIFMYISLIYSLYTAFKLASFDIRLSGIVGHSLTAAWYYIIFVSLNMIYSIYVKPKKDIYIIKDIAITLIGVIFTTGRVAMFISIILCLIYAFKCIKNRFIKFILIPLAIMLFINSNYFNEKIWQKFEYASGYGDITNGRLLGIREIMFYEVYPSFLLGGGIGYSNYITIYLFGTLNFENPILMFAFDYGWLITILIILITFLIPIIKLIINKKFIILLTFLAVYIIPYTYNGIAETTSLFLTLIYMVYFYLMIINNIDVSKSNIEE